MRESAKTRKPSSADRCPRMRQSALSANAKKKRAGDLNSSKAKCRDAPRRRIWSVRTAARCKRYRLSTYVGETRARHTCLNHCLLRNDRFTGKLTAYAVLT